MTPLPLSEFLTPDQIEDLLYGLTLVQRIGYGRVTIVINDGHPHLIEIAVTNRLQRENSPRMKAARRKALEALGPE